MDVAGRPWTGASGYNRLVWEHWSVVAANLRQGLGVRVDSSVAVDRFFA